MSLNVTYADQVILDTVVYLCQIHIYITLSLELQTAVYMNKRNGQ